MPRALLVVDLEATCWERPAHRTGAMETIEIGALRVDPARPESATEFQSFVRPLRHPELSAFCRALTTITQAQVDAAEPFPAAFARFLAWIGDPREVLFASWGEFDRHQLRRDGARHGVPVPFDDHWNLRRAVGRRLGARRVTMEEALAGAGLVAQGTLHRGLDDARNIWRVARAVLGDELGERVARPAPSSPQRGAAPAPAWSAPGPLVEAPLADVEPPAVLFHGLGPAALQHARREGLRVPGRPHLWLAATVEEARRVVLRRGAVPVVLGVRAKEAWSAGVRFHAAEDGGFLARAIPARFVDFPRAGPAEFPAR